MELLEKCRPLNDYSFFVEAVRKYRRQDVNIKDAVDFAIDDLKGDSQIKKFLSSLREELPMLWITEYDEEKDRELLREDAFGEGRAEGRAEEAKRIGSLISKLLELDRIDDAKKASTDAGFREQMYEEFGL